MELRQGIRITQKHMAIALVSLLCWVHTVLAQSTPVPQEFGFKLPPKVRRVSFPFEHYNNLIVIPVTVNRFIKLKFILDTGVETAILTEKLYADLLGLRYLRKINIAGPGIMDSVQAIVAMGATFDLPGEITGQNMNLLVLEEDYLKLSESMGDEVNGIIGYDVFSRFVVEINYDDHLITLHNPKKFRRPKRVTKVPIKIIGSKPFIAARLKQDEQDEELDFMVDTGASHAALIDYSNISSLDLPDQKVETKLGRGIAGEIPGYLGRMDTLSIAEFEFDEVLVSAPFQGIYNKAIKRGARIGTLGGELLTRFNIVFDYKDELIYLKKGKKYNEGFEHDMSGLVIHATGDKLDTLRVVSVDAGSPADIADIREGDVIRSIEGKSLSSHSLSDIYGLLRSRDGRKIKARLLRNGQKVTAYFKLQRKI